MRAKTYGCTLSLRIREKISQNALSIQYDPAHERYMISSQYRTTHADHAQLRARADVNRHAQLLIRANTCEYMLSSCYVHKHDFHNVLTHAETCHALNACRYTLSLDICTHTLISATRLHVQLPISGNI
jgi:hypothetical protein